MRRTSKVRRTFLLIMAMSTKRVKMMWRFLSCVGVLNLIAIRAAFATVYPVASAADIRNAMLQAQPGDTLLMRDGVWMDEHIVFKGDGTEENPIVLRPRNPGHVILTGSSSLRIAGTYLVVDGLRFIAGESRSGAVVEFRDGASRPAHHCRLTNTAIVDYNPDTKTRDYKWVSLYGSHNRVDHCFFAGKTHLGTTLVVWLSSQPNYHLIDHNYFGHRPPLGMNGGETIRVGTSDWSMFDSFTTVEYNYFEHCNGETEIISNKSGNNVYRYNTFYECEGTLTLRHGNHATVEGNFFLGNRNYKSGGVRVIGEGHRIINNYFQGLYGNDLRAAMPIMNGVPNSPLNRYFQVKNVVIAFNTFVDCRYSIILGAGKDAEKTLPPENCVIANNLVSTSYDMIRQDDEPINLRWEGNIMHGKSLGIAPPEGISLADPMLVQADDGLWRPDSSSPAIDAAVGEYALVTQDMDGQPRTSAKDVGADELSDAPILRRPLTAGDVGPVWMGTEVPLFLGVQIIGSGRVELSPAGGVYAAGEPVTLTAIPDSGWRFSGWQGDITDTTASVRITMTKNLNVMAVFAEDVPPVFALSVYVFSSGGHVELDPPGGMYPEGTVVTVTAVPDSGWRFVSWMGSLSGSANPDSLVMDAEKSIVATFARVATFVRDNGIPRQYALRQNYPNPASKKTTLSFALQRPGAVTVVIYDALGHVKTQLERRMLPAGAHLLEVDASGWPAGTYFYKIISGEFVAVKKMIVIH